jgi:AcrR family transcriptional regulator
MVVERGQLTRERIVATAHDLIAAEGLEALSLRRVAARLGVTAPALYGYVDDKVDLLQAVAATQFERLLATFDAIEATDPYERVRAQALAYVRHALDDPALFAVMFAVRPDWAAAPGEEDLPAATRAFAAGAAAVEAAIAGGQLRDEDPFVVSLALWSAAHGVATVVLAGVDLGDEFTERLAAAVVDNLLTGFAAPAP